jgi:chemotaxis methyl-accepting protein methylase
VPLAPPGARDLIAPATPSLAAGDVERVLAALQAQSGCDLSGNRPATIARRLLQRVAAAGDATLDAYLARLASDPDEPEALLAQLTIKVSSFFRDDAAFRALAEVAVPALRVRADGAPLRAWSAGCARGEEAFSLAMLLADGARAPWSVLGTDLDARAVSMARSGAYASGAAAAVPPALRGAWLEPAAGGWRVGEPLARHVRFARHDLAAGARADPGAFELVACRNVLIYFDVPLQRRVLALLLDHLAPGGFLLLGTSEWPTSEAAQRLSVVDRRARLFQLSSPLHAQEPR